MNIWTENWDRYRMSLHSWEVLDTHGENEELMLVRCEEVLGVPSVQVVNVIVKDGVIRVMSKEGLERKFKDMCEEYDKK